MTSKKSKIEQLPKSRESLFLAASVCCKPQQDTYEALWSISCDAMWPLTLARVRRVRDAAKFSSPARKTFFDSIDPSRKSSVRRSRGEILILRQAKIILILLQRVVVKRPGLVIRLSIKPRFCFAKGLIERDTGGHLALTDQGHAALRASCRDARAEGSGLRLVGLLAY